MYEAKAKVLGECKLRHQTSPKSLNRFDEAWHLEPPATRTIRSHVWSVDWANTQFSAVRFLCLSFFFSFTCTGCTSGPVFYDNTYFYARNSMQRSAFLESLILLPMYSVKLQWKPTENHFQLHRRKDKIAIILKRQIRSAQIWVTK